VNLRQIEVFRAVMLSGSVTEAAQLLHVSQPGISRMLGHIELQLGILLFERRKGRLLATPEAHALFAEVTHVYSGIRRIDECAEALKSGARLSLRVVVSPSVALTAVPRAATALVARFPDAKLFIETLPAREMASRLVSREADVAIATIPIENALLASRKVGQWRLVCVFPKGHKLGAKKRVQGRDLVRERLVSFSSDTPQGEIISDWHERNRVRTHSSFEVRAGQMACALVAAGAGVAVVDELTARDNLGRALDFRPIAGSPSFGIFSVNHAGFPLSSIGRSFAECVIDALEEMTPVRDRAGPSPDR
jgi:DNA-binding transcriptional LysR family regulator